jgi:hypothetical protein
MWFKTGFERIRIATLVGGVLVGGSGAAWAQQKTYEGDVASVDVKDMTYTVRGTRRGEDVEMAFHVGPGSQLFIGGERRLLGEIVKGDHVVVTYGTMAGRHNAERTERIKTVVREQTFAGDVIAVDTAARTFTVKNSTHGQAQEMRFHVGRGAELYIGGERVLLDQIVKGDTVTVAYETVATEHHLRHVKKNG